MWGDGGVSMGRHCAQGDGAVGDKLYKETAPAGSAIPESKFCAELLMNTDDPGNTGVLSSPTA